MARPRCVAARVEFLDLAVALSWSESAVLWCFPIETVSQSDGGVEGVYQSSSVLPHWHVTAGADGRWAVWIRWSVARGAITSSSVREPGLLAVAASS